MKKIKLSNCNEYALVDDSDYKNLIEYTWRKNAQGYAVRRTYTRISKGLRHAKDIRMHRQIMGEPEGMEVDHKNSRGLDNQRSNLRVATHQQNMCNRRKQTNNTSGYTGVQWHKNSKKWHSVIQVMGKTISLGYFTNKVSAAKSYNEASAKYFGEFGRSNPV